MDSMLIIYSTAYNMVQLEFVQNSSNQRTETYKNLNGPLMTYKLTWLFCLFNINTVQYKQIHQ